MALYQWPVDHFPPVGTLHPQKLQLIDRVDYERAKRWILNPKQIDPNTALEADANPAQTASAQ